ncbi:hypothetical protein GCM10011385_14270 [Nitratireductor aestuarii]|uniref:Uncharacterized protein n=1 Tax=Nitratireductor aestuarii TaxID=1735103 RepID=A0A916RPR2_9HYPH|nr:hypothetical protein [Nitratireductor aestuarii]GGA61708.1 hypothetical protein GCM10011385_14270 [Nitratireductor aestuarii]
MAQRKPAGYSIAAPEQGGENKKNVSRLVHEAVMTVLDMAENLPLWCGWLERRNLSHLNSMAIREEWITGCSSVIDSRDPST